MNNKYLKYGLEKLLDDQKFISWAMHDINDNEWKSFFSNNPDFCEVAQKAKEIVLLLKDSNDELNEDDIHTMWQKIEHYYTVYRKKGKMIFLSKVLRYAAVLLAIVTIGVTSYLYFTRSNQKYIFASGDSIPKNGEAKLVLPNGEEVHLKKDNSSVVIRGKEAILINNEQSIDLRNREQLIEEEVKMNEVIIPYGKKSFLVLDDGTKVWLCAGSRLAFPTIFTRKNREVYLEGEAYFEVTNIPDQPFIVFASEISLKVLGTRFNISAYSSDKEIITVLLEGSVELKENSSFGLSRKEIIMEPGQKASFIRSNKSINVEQETNMEFYIAWTEGWFLFSKESLIAVFNKLERFYNVKFIYGKSFPSDDLISGKLDLKDSISDVLVTLSNLSNISYKIGTESIYIERKLK